MGGEAFEKRLVHSVALIIMAQSDFIPQLKSFIADVLKCNACLKTNFKCVCYYVLVMILFGNRLIKVSAMF